MKKITLIMLMVFSALLLVACSDTQTKDTSLGVVFFTYANDTNNVIQKIEEGKPLTKPEDPQRDGYAFLMWSTIPQRDGVAVDYSYEWDFDTIVTKSMTLFATWESRAFIIEYELNGGQWPAGYTPVSEFNSGDTVFLTNPSSREGYTFAGWFDKPIDQVLSSDQPLLSISGRLSDVKLYAKWNPRTFTMRFVSGLEGVANPSPSARNIAYGLVIDVESQSPNFPWLSDTSTHRFLGWVDTAGKMYVQGTVFDRLASGTLTGVWEVK